MAGLLNRLFKRQPREVVTETRAYDDAWAILVNAGIKNYKAGITEETALSISAVYAAVDRISSSLATVPFNIYERRGGGDRMLATDHDQFYLIHTAPNKNTTSSRFLKTLIASALLWGNGYALITRNKSGRPESYKWIHPKKVDVTEVEDQIFYKIDGIKDPVPGEDMIHIAGMGFDGLKGKSPIAVHAEMLGAAKARITYGASIMDNGGFMSGILKFKQVLKPEQKAAIKEGWDARYSGADKAGTTAILDGEADYQQLSINPEDAQLIELMQFTVEDIARIYGIPPHMIGHLERSTNNNIEQQSIEYVQYCLLPWAKTIEQTYDSRIFTTADTKNRRYYTKLELNALLRGDITARKEFYMAMLDRGVLSIDEVRGLEELNSVEGGDTRLVMANMIPLSKIEDFYNQKNNGSTQN